MLKKMLQNDAYDINKMLLEALDNMLKKFDSNDVIDIKFGNKLLKEASKSLQGNVISAENSNNRNEITRMNIKAGKN